MRNNRRKTMKSNTFPMITMGKVIDTNDPKQMGRVRVKCAALGDTDDMLLRDLPWATYVSPLAGIMERGSRGREDDTTLGPVAYGMWNIPKVGAVAMVACLDGDPRLRVYFGQIHGDLMTHTLPHGRFSMQGTIPDVGDSLSEFDSESGRPLGPFNSREEAIQPQFDKLVESFTAPTTNVLDLTLPDTPQRNYEYFTRGADKSVSRLTEELVFDQNNASFARDDLEDPYLIDSGDTVRYHTQGYQQSRVEPGADSELTGKTFDSQIYSWTTPGFHSVAMDDAPGNCRVRFRTTHGHQIILDDTNERIYISTAGGKSWVELDEQGNIDFYAERNISFHAKKDFNITADNIRMTAKSGIHMESDGETRIHSKAETNIKSDTNVRIHAEQEMRLQARLGNLHIDTGGSASVTAAGQADIVVGETLYINAGTDIDATATGDMHLAGANNNVTATGGSASVLASASVLLTGAQVHANGPPATAAAASTATASEPSEFKEAWLTSRIPEHEPWPRVMTDPAITDLDVGNTHTNSAEFVYNDPNVGKVERGEELPRNKNWKR